MDKPDTPDCQTAVRPEKSGNSPQIGTRKGNPTGLYDLDPETAEAPRNTVHMTGIPSELCNFGDDDGWCDDPFKAAHQFVYLDDENFNSLFDVNTYAKLSGRSPAEARGSHQLMVVLATINGCRVRVLLDSGCTSEITARWLER